MSYGLKTMIVSITCVLFMVHNISAYAKHNKSVERIKKGKISKKTKLPIVTKNRNFKKKTPKI